MSGMGEDDAAEVWMDVDWTPPEDPNAEVLTCYTEAQLAAHDARVRAEALAPIEALAEEWASIGEGTAESEWDEGFRDGYRDCARALRAAMEAKG